MRYFILGGGCYGSFYAEQLLRARSTGALAVAEVTIVDHGTDPAAARDPDLAGQVRFVKSEWDDFFDGFLEDQPTSSPDCFVPSPFNPHLGMAWLVRVLARAYPDCELTLERFGRLPGTPFQEQREHGTLVASHADWVCPVHCIEPETCPKTRGPRHWDMDRTARQLAHELDKAGQAIDQVHLFHCHHISHGVGGYPVAELVHARSDLESALSRQNDTVRALVGTVSHCHGAFHLLAARTGMDTVSDASGSSGQLPDGAGGRK